MKIVIIGTAYPYRGGLATFNERLARQFSEEGHDVHIETFTLQYPNFLFPGKTQYSESPAPTDLHITRSVNSCNPFNWLHVGKKVRRMNPDIVIMKFWIPYMAPCLGSIARIIRKNRHTQVISILDNVIPHEPHFWDKWMIRYFVRSVDRFVAMSESVAADLRLFTDTKPCSLVRHPLYDNFGTPVSKQEAASKLGLEPDKTYLLFFGLIRDYKGLDLLMHAYADPRIDKDEVKLVVAGEFYGNEDKYNALLRELGLQDIVIWHTRYIPDEEVSTYFSLADLIVQPYKSATQSGVTQIAYHFSKPMLVTNVGGLPEIVPDGKVGYVTEVSAEAIATALADFASNPASDRFAAGIAEEKARYGWDKMTQAILNNNNTKDI
ncbi:MAG: glycosyltransferase [Paludibacteraceae bacterium]|nr:glycosyltransferase [Paludibacteraceae bacterium]